MSADTFFEKAADRSIVKTRIVYEYFGAWFNVMRSKARSHQLAYIDLYCGKGAYDDGVKSTPLLILEQAASDDVMRDRLVTLFNDDSPDYVQVLEQAVRAIPDIDKMRFKPTFWNKRIDSDVSEYFREIRLVPTLLFADPWGYKGLSVDLIKYVVRNWGTDCIFFFNFNRVNMHLGQSIMDQNMRELFGTERAERLFRELDEITSPSDRERAVIGAFADELRTFGVKYAPYFTFKCDDGTKTSHHIIMASKDALADRIIRGIYAKWSSSSEDGVASFGFNPVEVRRAKAPKQPGLFDSLDDDPDLIDDLGNELVREFAGRLMTVPEIMAEYNAQHFGRRFTDSNFKEAVKRLLSQGRVTLPDGVKRRGNTLADRLPITFPAREQ